jgi:hypothetical protein
MDIVSYDDLINMLNIPDSVVEEEGWEAQELLLRPCYSKQEADMRYYEHRLRSEDSYYHQLLVDLCITKR